MKGYKGFNKGLVCRGKQYAENTVFEEDTAEICKSGMHFCENPFDVLSYYGFITDNGELNEFAEVEALDEVKTDDGKKYCTKKLKIGAKIGIEGLVKAFVDFTLEKIHSDKKISNTGDYSASTNTGDWSASTNTGNWSASTNTGSYSVSTSTGDCSASTNTGDWSAASVEGKDSFAMAIGYQSMAKGALGCYIVLAEWEIDNGERILKTAKMAKVDGETIKADTWYKLKNGEFVETD